MSIIVAIAVTIALLAGVGAFIYWIVKKSPQAIASRDIDAHLDRIAVEHSVQVHDRSVRVVKRDHGITMTYVPQQGKHPGNLTTDLNLPTMPQWPNGFAPLDNDALASPRQLEWKPSILLRKERWLDRVGKFLRINREIQTGDRDFDRQIYIETNAPDDLVQELLYNPALRRGVVTLLDSHYQRVRLFTGASPIDAYCSPPNSEALAPGTDRDVIDAMVDIASAMPAITVEKPDAKPTTLGDKIAGFSAVFGLLFGIASIFTFSIFRTISDDIYYVGLFGAWGLWVLLFPVFVAIMRGSSTGLQNLIITTAILFFTLPPISIATLRCTNALLDFSSPRAVTAKLVDKRISRGSKSTSYYATFKFKDHPETEFRLFSSEYFDLPSEGSKTKIVLKDGALGWLWVDDFNP